MTAAASAAAAPGRAKAYAPENKIICFLGCSSPTVRHLCRNARKRLKFSRENDLSPPEETPSVSYSPCPEKRFLEILIENWLFVVPRIKMGQSTVMLECFGLGLNSPV